MLHDTRLILTRAGARRAVPLRIIIQKCKTGRVWNSPPHFPASTRQNNRFYCILTLMNKNNFSVRNINILVFTWFFFSGVAALIYQVLWARQLELLFGNTLYAISTILSVFMAGLALGSYLFGRVVDRSKNPLRLYSILEGIIGLYALLTPVFFWLLPRILVALNSILPAGSAQFSPIYFIFSFLLLILPTTLMGGTLPILSKYLVASQNELGKKIGNLYFINTLGAAFGTILTGFILIFLMGTQFTTLTAAIINLAVAVSAFMVAHAVQWSPAKASLESGVSGQQSAISSTGVPPVHGGQESDVGEERNIESTSNSITKSANTNPGNLSAPAHIIILVGYGLAGFAALGLEVQWTKVLTLMIGTSVYAFSLMLFAFLTGIALGSFFMAKFVDSRKNLWRDFAIIEILLGLSILVLNPLLGNLPRLFANVFQYKDIFWLLQAAEFVVIFLIMLVPTLLMGAAFPVVSKIYAHDVSKVGKRISQIYTANTVGSILGPLAVSFLFIPLFGLQNSILLTSVIYVIVGMAVLAYSSSVRPFLKGAVFAFLTAVFVFSSIFIPRWNKLVLSSGVYYHSSSFLANAEESNYNLVFYKEGQMAVVTVIRGTDNNLALLMNGKVDASTQSDLGTQLLSGHMPMLLHPNPKKAFLVGLASGITLGAILQHPELERVDVAELEPTVPEAAATFARFNNNAMSNPKVRVFTTDARNYILTTNEKYDVIAAEPSNPWVKGSSTIFSREVFETYRDRLNEDGLVMQWVQVYRLRNEDLKTMINTFRSVFPHTTLFSQFNYPDLLMIGSLKPLKLDLDTLQTKLRDENVNKSLARVRSNDLYTILSFLLMDESSVALYAGEAPINTDDKPIIEYTAPKNMYLNTTGSNWESMRGLRTNALALLPNLKGTPVGDRIQKDFEARENYLQGTVYSEQGLWNKAMQAWEEAWNLSPANGSIQQGLAGSYESAGEYFFTQNYYKEALEQYELSLKVMPDKPSVWVNLGDLSSAVGEPQRAILLYEKALKLDELNPFLMYKIARIYREQGNYTKSLEYLNRAIEIYPDYSLGYIDRGYVYSKQFEYDEAINDYNRALALKQARSKFLGYLYRGWAYYNKGNLRQSIRDYTIAIKIKPTAEAYDLRAISNIALKQYKDALKDANQTLKLQEDYDMAYYHRGQALAGLGKKSEAIYNYEKYLSITGDTSMRDAAILELSRLKGQ